MLNPVMKTDDGKKYIDPNLFNAARNDDPDELSAAIAAGKSLNEQLPQMNEWTPIHYACYLKSSRFLSTALREEFDPWLADVNGRRAVDIARINGLSDAQKSLLEAMYPDGPGGFAIDFSAENDGPE